jgi:hypothetical protein
MSIRSALRCTLAFFAALLLSVSANAQLFRAYLAPTGLDTNPCTLPAPCRLLPAALAAVADGGEIWVLDSANYNTAPVTIGKSVSILAVPGAVASVLSIGGPAINITAAGLKVALRNLVIVALAGGGGSHGVAMTGASSLTIEDSLLANLPSNGVYVIGTGTLKITNTTLRNNGSYAVWAVNGANVSVSGTKMLGNTNGGVLAQSTTATTTTAVVSDSIISGGIDGVFAYTSIPGAIAQVLVTRCTIESVTFGLDSSTSFAGFGSALVAVSNSMITKNSYGWAQTNAGSVIKSLGNNHIQDNTNAPLGVLTPVSLQ